MSDYLIGYPRCGNTWVRYIISTVTLGIVTKTHEYKTDIKRDDRLLFCIRNYKECITRHMRARTLEDFKKPVNYYMQLLKMYDEFTGIKVIIYYEDLIEDPNTIIPRITELFGNRFNYDVDKFLINYEQHQEESLQKYISVTGMSHDEGWSVNDTVVHSKKLTEEVKKEVDAFIKKINLSDKYLSRYYD